MRRTPQAFQVPPHLDVYNVSFDSDSRTAQASQRAHASVSIVLDFTDAEIMSFLRRRLVAATRNCH
jgi:hypothetical protein